MKYLSQIQFIIVFHRGTKAYLLVLTSNRLIIAFLNTIKENTLCGSFSSQSIVDTLLKSYHLPIPVLRAQVKYGLH